MELELQSTWELVQSDLKFNQILELKKVKTSQTHGAIKHVLHDAPKNGLFLAYISICGLLMENADTCETPPSMRT